jgi:hypothetical protein
MGANTKYKDSVFSFLFSDPDTLRELYCALGGVSLPQDIPVTINTLNDVLYMDMINDISFEIGGKLVVLLEHQSTINPNIALRFLMYIARVYEKTLESKNIYGTRRISIPRPEFFVLYNGTAPYPDEKVLRLSEMFEDISSFGFSEESATLELEVKVININSGRNSTIVNQSKTLAGYSLFVSKVRENIQSGLEKEPAMKQAIIYCRDHDVLKEFFENNASEVLNMLMTEWNWDDAKQVWFEEGREEGWEKGLEKGWEGSREYFLQLLNEGLSVEEIKQRLEQMQISMIT